MNDFPEFSGRLTRARGFRIRLANDYKMKGAIVRGVSVLFVERGLEPLAEACEGVAAPARASRAGTTCVMIRAGREVIDSAMIDDALARFTNPRDTGDSPPNTGAILRLAA